MSGPSLEDQVYSRRAENLTPRHVDRLRKYADYVEEGGLGGGIQHNDEVAAYTRCLGVHRELGLVLAEGSIPSPGLGGDRPLQEDMNLTDCLHRYGVPSNLGLDLTKVECTKCGDQALLTRKLDEEVEPATGFDVVASELDQYDAEIVHVVYWNPNPERIRWAAFRDVMDDGDGGVIGRPLETDHEKGITTIPESSIAATAHVPREDFDRTISETEGTRRLPYVGGL